MNPLTIIQALEALASLIGEVAPLVSSGQSVISETDANAIHAALLKAEAATALLRPQVDAALDAASKE